MLKQVYAFNTHGQYNMYKQALSSENSLRDNKKSYLTQIPFVALCLFTWLFCVVGIVSSKDDRRTIRKHVLHITTRSIEDDIPLTVQSVKMLIGQICPGSVVRQHRLYTSGVMAVLLYHFHGHPHFKR